MQTTTNALVPSKEELTIYQTIAQTASESKYFDKLGGPAGMLAIMLYAREIGVSPMMSVMGGFSNIQGKITMSSELMSALIRRAGHKLEVIQHDNQVCKIKGTRCDTGESCSVSFTLEEAKGAGLFRSGGGWEKYPSDMLFARCISRLRRRLFSDVATRSYVEGELDEPLKEEKITTLEAENISVNKDQPAVEKQYLTSDQCQEILDLIGDDLDLAERILKGYKVKSLDQVEEKNYQPIMNKLKARKAS